MKLSRPSHAEANSLDRQWEEKNLETLTRRRKEAEATKERKNKRKKGAKGHITHLRLTQGIQRDG